MVLLGIHSESHNSYHLPIINIIQLILLIRQNDEFYGDWNDCFWWCYPG